MVECFIVQSSWEQMIEVTLLLSLLFMIINNVDHCVYTVKSG